MKVYVTRRNADINAGSGPMVLDKIFLLKKSAIAYIDSQPGVQGRRAKWSDQKHGDWTYEEVEVFEGVYDPKVEHVQKILKEISDALTDEQYQVFVEHILETYAPTV